MPGCSVDYVKYESTDCSGVGSVTDTYAFTGSCDNGDDNWNVVGSSGIQSCTSSDPGDQSSSFPTATATTTTHNISVMIIIIIITNINQII
jgi:hypothetical protein